MKVIAVGESADQVIIGDESGYLTIWDFTQLSAIGADLAVRKEVNPVQDVEVVEYGVIIIATLQDEIRVIGRSKKDTFRRQLPIEPNTETDTRFVVTALAIKNSKIVTITLCWDHPKI